MHRLAAILAVLSLSWPAAAQEQLEAGRVVQGRFTPGQPRRFLLTLAADRFVQIRLRSQAPPAAMKLIAPDGAEPFAAIASEPARQDLFAITGAPGGYTLEVQWRQPGPFELAIEQVRAIAPGDRERVEGERLFAAAGILRDGSGPDPLGGSVESYRKAAERFHAGRQTGREAAALHEIGVTYYGFRDPANALVYLRQSAEAFREAGDAAQEAGVLTELGAVSAPADPAAAAGAYERALGLFRQIGSKPGEAMVLNNLGAVSWQMGDPAKAIGYYEQSLPMRRASGDEAGEANTLNNLGTAQDALSHYEEAIGYFERARDIYRRLKNRPGEAGAIYNLGMAHQSLHQQDRAAALLNQALAIYRELRMRTDEAETLSGLAVVLRSQGQDEAAVRTLEATLPIIRESKQPSREGRLLANLGSAYVALGRMQDAHAAFDRSLALLRQSKDRTGEASALHDLAYLYEAERQPDKAAPLYAEALAIHRQTGDRQGEAETLSNLMTLWQSAGQPRLAAFYGKQSVNAYQSVRGNIKAAEAQQSFVKGVENTYRALADILLAQRRLPEAQQVLNFLKREEYFAFVRRDGNSAGPVGAVELTPEEKEWEARYRKVSDELTAIGAQRRDLVAKGDLSAQDEQRLERIEQDLMAGNEHFRRLLDELGVQFRAAPRAAARLQQVRDAEALKTDLRDLRKLSSKTGAVLYTLAGDDKYRAVLFTSEAQKAYERPVGAAELNRKILAFREVLQNPALDPRPLARELYDILIGPEMARDLEQARTDVLMWSPDGLLRYLPLAALFDGKKYLVERYALEVFTPASMGRLKDPPLKDWTASGFGLTRAYENFAALPGVSRELAVIGGPGAVLHGTVLLDDQFRKEAMLRAFRQSSVIHVASHFSFRPGNETNSFLLLGDGSHLTLSELERFPAMDGVELFTLSACNTGIGADSGDGREVEGLGVLAQRKGAKAVIASLWEVSDQSTTALMRRFYEYRAKKGLPKAEALRLAQLDMLKGDIRPDTGGAAESRGVRTRRDADRAAPEFTAPAGAPYAHPYYWAPFFLMGNWL